MENSVFFYFPNEAYAEKVIDKMLKKTKSKVVILDVNDKDKKYIAEKKRRNMLSQSEYEKKYKDLQHLYYNKQFFIDIAIKYNYKIKIFKQKIYNYSANFYRFNVIIDKHSDFDKNINGA